MTWRGHLLVMLLLCFAGIGHSEPFADTERAMHAELGNGFRYGRSEVFVCAGNLPAAEFNAILDGTIGGCARLLWTQYFTRRPTYPIRVYLFRDGASYRAYARKLFDDTEVSHFGYYKPDRKALVMNIGTGTGTLVHEMAHALMAPDFPGAPTWFSEGLASLYEQCNSTRDGLVGLVNWRLPVLRGGQQRGTTLPLARLIATSRAEFLDAQMGVHYAQARYLCLYLQERGLLDEFYREFRDHAGKDPTGAKALQRVCGKSLPEIEKEWLAWVATL